VNAKKDNVLLEGWDLTTLGNIRQKCSSGIVPNKSPDQYFELYSVPSFEKQSPEIILGKEIGSNKQIVKEGTVLLCKINPRINRAWVVGSHSKYQKIASTEWIPFSPVKGVNPKYLCYYLRQNEIRDFLSANVSGVGGSLMRVRPAVIEDYPFPLIPIDQQKLIVAEIEKQFSRLDEAVAALKKIQANLKRYKASVLKAAVEGKLTEQWRKEHPDVEPASELLKRILAERRKKWEDKNPGKKYKEPSTPDTSKLPELPKGWVWATAEQLCDFITKGTTPSKTKLFEGAGEVQFLKVYNLTFTGQLNYKYKSAYVSRETHEEELARSRVFPGDILINIVGPPLGQVSIVPEALPEANINQAIARFRMLGEMSGRYFAIALMSKEIMGWAIKRAKTTAGQANLTLELCRALPVPLPPLSEQKNIIEEIEQCFSVTEETEDMSVTNIKRAERLRQAILKKAFQGRLTKR